MSIRVVFAVVLLVVTAVGAGVVVADTPSLSVTVDGEAASGGGEFVLNRNPDLAIEASADDRIDSVVVRINDESVRTFSPNSSTFSEEFTPQLDNNERNTVNVIVRDSASGVESMQFTITKDGIAPFIGFDSPFESQLGSRPPERVSETESLLTFAGSFEDITGVEILSIQRRHFYTTLGEERIETSNQQIQDPGSSFSTDVFLGYGRNVIEIRMIDRFQNARVYTIEFDINDRTAPEVAVDETPAETRNNSLVLSGEASDNVQIDEVTYSVEGSVDSATLVVSQGDGADPERRSVPFEQEIGLTPGENVVRVTARDVSGRTSTVRRVVVYNDTIVPRMSITNAASADGSVRFGGFVSQGSFSRVSVETVDPESGETLDFKPLYDGEPTGRNVTFEEQMAAVEDGPTEVVLRVVDREGEEYVRRATVRPGSGDGAAGTDAGGSGGSDASDDGASDGGSGSDADSSGGNDGDAGANGNDDAASTPTVIPGFGVGHALVAVGAAALVLLRRREG